MCQGDQELMVHTLVQRALLLGVNPLPFVCLLRPVVSCYSSSSTCPFPSKISRNRKLSPPSVDCPATFSLRDDRSLRSSLTQQPSSLSMTWGSKTFCSQWAGLKTPYIPHHSHREHTAVNTPPCPHTQKCVATSCTLLPVHHTVLIPNTPETQIQPPFLPHLPPQSGNEQWNAGWKKCME